MRNTSLHRLLSVGAGVVTAIVCGSVWAQTTASKVVHGAPTYWYPPSNTQKPSDIGIYAHTNVIGVILPDAGAKPTAAGSGISPSLPPLSGYYNETPSSLACVYGFVAQTAGCNPTTATAVITGGSGMSIAIVDAYDDPTAVADLNYFDTQFNLPAPPGGLHVVYASGSVPPVNSGWTLESALDVQWAHAMSPNSKIYLVEAASNSDADLLVAVDKAAALVAADGGGVVSMSWGGSEWSTEASYDSHFQKANVTFLASTGDAPGTEWPSVSQYVVAVGGTSISRNPTNGNYIGELVWQQTGSGISAYVAKPPYQGPVSVGQGNYRVVPDIAAEADPDTGVWVYLSGGWWLVGGTSVASPVEAGVIAHDGFKSTNFQGFLNKLYAGSLGNLRDITSGNCGPYAGYVAAVGYDLCTGRGSMLGGMRLSVAGATTP